MIHTWPKNVVVFILYVIIVVRWCLLFPPWEYLSSSSSSPSSSSVSPLSGLCQDLVHRLVLWGRTCHHHHRMCYGFSSSCLSWIVLNWTEPYMSFCPLFSNQAKQKQNKTRQMHIHSKQLQLLLQLHLSVTINDIPILGHFLFNKRIGHFWWWGEMWKESGKKPQV